MSELIAQGPHLDHRWRRTLPTAETITLGRATPSFCVPWDDRVSREHVRICWLGDVLTVEKIPTAANPIFFNGQAAENFVVEPGEHFVIGKTTFTLSKEQAFVTLDSPNPIRQRTFSPEFLRQIHFRNAEQRIDVLNRLPDVISSANNEQDLLNRLSNTLLAGIPRARAIAFVRIGDAEAIEVIHWDRSAGMLGDFQPSGKLIRQAIQVNETVLHWWQQNPVVGTEFTVDLENDWAFVCPLAGNATRGWGIYVAGTQPVAVTGTDRDSDGQDLQGDVKFCELVGSTLKNLLLVKQLERRQASLRGFFSPIVLDAIAGRDADEVLQPQQAMLSVMFCDLRGFAKKSEQMNAELFRLLERVSQSLAVMTNQILQNGGVVGDFHGDSAMGFWGWPLPQSDHASRAVAAALAIQAEFLSNQSSGNDFQIGIGIASGIAVAGKIGSRDQVKVTAFGPVVNLASRLEGLNRLLDTSVLIDEATFERVAEQADQLDCRFRSLGKFQPYGLTVAVEVFQVLRKNNSVVVSRLKEFSDALVAFQHGDWDAAKLLLATISDSDRGKRFLLEFMARTEFEPPTDWDGVVRLSSK